MQHTCPNCSVEFQTVEETASSSVRCPTCDHEFASTDSTKRSTGDPWLVETQTEHVEKRTTIAHFQLINQLGRGQFGSVWKARDTKLDRDVAIKLPGRVETGSQRDSFLREARAVAQLHHPNIVGIHEAGVDDDTLFIVSDFVQGADLREWLTQYQPSHRQTAKICRSIARALHHAHEAGVIHRDLKPANIMMDLDGRPHIMDFGLAKRESGEQTVTLQGTVLGTPAYMSPEQARGESHTVDRRADIYSLGVVLFEMLTGDRPFRGERQVLLMQIVERDAPRLRSLNTTVPIDLETICLRCLEKEPSARYQTAENVADELDRFLRKEPIHARPISAPARAWRLCRRWPVASCLAACLLLAVTLGIVGITSQLIRANREWQRAEVNATHLARQQQLTQQYLYVAHMNIIQQAWENGVVQEVRRLLDEHLPQPGQRDIRTFEWFLYDRLCQRALSAKSLDFGEIVTVVEASPAGNEIAVTGNGGRVEIWDRDSQRRVQVLSEPNDRTVAIRYSSDGQTLVGTEQSQFHVWRKRGDDFVHAFSGPTSRPYQIRLSHDGQWFASAIPENAIQVWNIADPETTYRLPGHSARVNDLQFLNDGKHLISVSNDATAKLWRIGDEDSGKELVVTTDGPVNSLAVSRDDSFLALAFGTTARIYRFTADKDVELVHDLGVVDIDNEFMVTLNDGATFVVVGKIRLSVYEFESGQLRGRLADPKKFYKRVDSSSDGLRFASYAAGNFAYLWDAESVGAIGTVKAHANVVYGMDYSDDDMIITGSRDGTVRITAPESVEDSVTLRGHSDWIWSIDFSPDGRLLASGGRDQTVKVWDVATGRRVLDLNGHTDSVQCVRFAPDNQTLASSSHDRTIRVTDVKTGQLVATLQGHDDDVNALDFSTDGKLMVSGSDDGTVVVWDIETGKIKHRLQAGSDYIWGLAFAPDDKSVVFGGPSKKIEIWEFGESGDVSVLKEYDADVTSLIFAPDRTTLSATTSNGTISLFDYGSRKLKTELTGHSSDAMSTSFSPDSQTLASGCSDARIRFWNLPTGKLTISLGGHSDHVHTVSFSPDGSKVASSSWDGTIKIWNGRESD